MKVAPSSIGFGAFGAARTVRFSRVFGANLVGAIVCVAIASGASGVLAPTVAAQETPSPAVEPWSDEDPEGIAFFEERIRPILIERCYECHSSESQASEGGLRLDDRPALRAGGDSGAGVVPGEPSGSRLIDAIRYTTDFYAMPPDGKLPDAVIADFVTWIERGAPDPRDGSAVETAPHASIDWESARTFWAFVPPVDRPAPGADVTRRRLDRTGQAIEPAGPIDAWWSARMGDSPVVPAERASAETLLRRVTYDLLGLPPEPERIETFVRDHRPDAFEREVDRLLASPRYGEKWGRHWLDVARYGDSNGLDENLAYSNAFRYRDWVIRSRNDDLPYDEFIRLQIAGDLLGDDRDPIGAVSLGGGAAHDEIDVVGTLVERARDERFAARIATGFLSIGAKMLACDDGRKMELDIIDEQVETLGKAVLGMTFGCARCHDHKFDPILQRDYYALAGIFKSTRTMENFNVVAVWHEHELATDSELASRETLRGEIATQRAEIATRRQEANDGANRETVERRDDYAIAIAELGSRGAIETTDGRRSIAAESERDRWPSEALERQAEDFDRGSLVVDREHWGKSIGVLLQSGFAEYDLTVPSAGRYQLELRYAAAESRPIRILLDGRAVNESAAAEPTDGWSEAEQRWSAEGLFELSAGRHVLRLEREGAVPHLDRWALIPIGRNDDPLATHAAERSLRRAILAAGFARWSSTVPIETRRTLGRLAADDAESFVAALQDSIAAADGTDPSDEVRALRSLAVMLQPGGAAHPGDDLAAWWTDEEREAITGLEARAGELEASVPTFPFAMGVREGKPEDLLIHIRGNYLTLGEAAPRGWPQVLTSVEAESSIDAERSGRAELAEWLVDARHPLTARVIANRLWRWHFSVGLVRTPDNFGLLGSPPTDPDLLDHLAIELVRGDWSLKRLQRRIVTSRVYAGAAEVDSHNAAVDPENLMGWHVPRRRLSAEEMRDSLLMVSGGLDWRMFGQPLRNPNREYVSGTAQNPATYASQQRTVYLPVLRSAVYDVLQAFDFPDPAVANGDRATSTIAPQALFALNGKPAVEASDRLASRASAIEDEAERIEWLVRQVLGRAVRPDETPRSIEFMAAYRRRLLDEGIEDRGEQDRRALAALARVLLATNEFAFVD